MSDTLKSDIAALRDELLSPPTEVIDGFYASGLFEGKRQIGEKLNAILAAHPEGAQEPGLRISEHDIEWSTHQPGVYHKLRVAVMKADESFEKKGDAGTKTWLDDHFLPELADAGLTIAALVVPQEPQADEERVEWVCACGAGFKNEADANQHSIDFDHEMPAPLAAGLVEAIAREMWCQHGNDTPWTALERGMKDRYRKYALAVWDLLRPSGLREALVNLISRAEEHAGLPGTTDLADAIEYARAALRGDEGK